MKADLKSNRTQGTAPLTVQFDASGSTYPSGSITNYKWDFGDGTPTSTGNAQLSHKYSTVGTYTATVTAVANDGSTDSASITITVRDVALSACFTSVFTEGQAPLTTKFDPACSTGTIKNYFWNFGDGISTSQVSPSHTFADSGEYTVMLEVTDENNNVSTADLLIKVTADE